MINGTRFRIDTDIARQSALSARIARGQADIASGKRLQAASDDPAAAARIAVLRGQAIDGAAWQGVADGAAALAAHADSALGSVASLIDRARELATSAASDTLSTADRSGIASELSALADQVDALPQERDANGAAIFPIGSALRVPVGTGLTIAVTTSRDDAFTVTTSGGPSDIGALLRNAAGALNGSTAARAAALGDIVAAGDHIAAVRGEQGARAARIDAMRDRLTETAATAAEERASIEDTDIAATIAHIQADQLSLDAAQAVFAKVNRRTLFDLLG